MASHVLTFRETWLVKLRVSQSNVQSDDVVNILPMVHPNKWLRPDLVPPAPSLQCKHHLTPGGSVVVADPGRIDEEFRKAWL